MKIETELRKHVSLNANGKIIPTAEDYAVADRTCGNLPPDASTRQRAEYFRMAEVAAMFRAAKENEAIGDWLIGSFYERLKEENQ